MEQQSPLNALAESSVNTASHANHAKNSNSTHVLFLKTLRSQGNVPSSPSKTCLYFIGYEKNLERNSKIQYFYQHI